LVKSFLRIESYKKGIFFSSAFHIVARLFTFLSSLLIAYYFGTQSKTDVYFYSYATILLIAGLMTSIDSSVLIPESMRIREQVGIEDSRKFLNLFLYFYVFIGALITLLFFINPISTFILISNFKSAVLFENKDLLNLAILLITCIIVSTFLVDILTSYKFFTIPMISQMINSAFTIIFIVVFNNIYGIKSILLGLLTAYLIQITLLIWLMIKYLNWNFLFKLYKIDGKVLKNIFFAQAGNITTTLTSYIPLYLLSSFSAGVITALNYGQKTSDMPNQFITTQFSSVIGIKFNELFAKNNFKRINEIFYESAKFLLYILIPISFLFFLYNKEIITILYGRGKFDEDSIRITSLFLKYFGLLLPLFAINTLTARLFMASQKIKEAVFYQFFFNIFLILLIISGVKIYGEIAYPLSLLLAYIFNVIFMYYFIKKYFDYINYNPVLIDFIKFVVLNIVIGIVIYEIKFLLQNTNVYLNLVIGTLIYVLIVVLLSYYYKIIPTFNTLLNFMNRKIS